MVHRTPADIFTLRCAWTGCHVVKSKQGVSNAPNRFASSWAVGWATNVLMLSVEPNLLALFLLFFSNVSFWFIFRYDRCSCLRLLIGMKTIGFIGKRFRHSHFHIFHPKRKWYDTIGNENGISITVILETKIYDRENIDNNRNLPKRYFKKW